MPTPPMTVISGSLHRVEVVERLRDQVVDGRRRIAAELSARLATTLGHCLGAGVGREIPCVHIVFDRAGDVFAFGGSAAGRC